MYSLQQSLFRFSLLLMALLSLNLLANGQIRYVKAGASGDGSSWATPSGDLQAMINASGVQEVWVATGTYKPTSTTARTVSFALKNGVAIYGGFPATGTPAFTDRNPGTNPTVLSGEIGSAGLSDNSFHVIFNTGLNNTAILDGFVVTGGNASGSGNDDAGGGIRSNNGSPIIRNCLFQGNSATFGGAFYSQNDGNPTLTNCGFLSNTATNSGGAIYVFDDSPALTNCSFQGNTAPANSGGAIGSSGGNAPTLTNCMLFGNGGANTIRGSQVSATYTLFEANTTGYSGTTGNLTTSSNPFISATSLELISNALAINAGNPATTTVTLGTAIDLAGNPRVFGARVDMGAYELQTAPTPSIAGLAASPNPVCTGNVATFTATIGNVTGTYDFTLSSDTGPISGTANTTAFSQTLTVSGAGSLSFTLTIAQGGFSATATTLLVVGASAFTVNSLDDTPDANLSDGVCADASGNCTFRAAVQESNVSGCSPLTITFGVTGAISLTSALPTLTHPNLSILGPGASQLTLERSSAGGTPNFRILDLNNTYVLVQGLTIRNGLMPGSGTQNRGAGIIARGTATVINECIIRDNYSGGGGGGISSNSSLTLTNSSVSNNTALFGSNPAFGEGGGVYLTGTGLSHIDNSTITQNIASVGGGLSVENGMVTMIRTVVSSNTATDAFGGGISIGLNGSVSMTNCIGMDNRVPSILEGHMAHISGSSLLTLEHCTVGGTGNRRAIYVERGRLQTRNSIFASIGQEFFTTPNATITSLGNNIIEDNTFPVASRHPTDLVNTNPLFVSATDFQLQDCSPAVNRANPAEGPATDVAGNTRPAQGIPDIGAYENQTSLGAPQTYSLLNSGPNTCTSSATLSLAGSETGVSYQLQHDGTATGGAVAGTGSALSFGPQSLSGTYTVLATRTLNSCAVVLPSSATMVSQTNTPALTITALPNNLTISSGQTATLTVSGGNTGGAFAYTWSDGSQTASLTVSPTATNVYSVTATNVYGCSTVQSVTLTVVTIPCNPILHVTESGSGLMDGSSWGNALPGTLLQIAIERAASCGGTRQVWVAGGTYKPTRTTARAVSFALRNNVAVHGGFVGSETDPSGRPALNPVLGQISSSTLSGEIGDPNSLTDNSYHVINNDIVSLSLNASALIDGFVITGGNATADNVCPHDYGGGMYNDGASPTVNNCLFTRNMAAYRGGGMCNRKANSGQVSSPLITNCVFQSNSVTFQGGGMANLLSNTNPTLINVIFRENRAGLDGGGLFNYSLSNPILVNTVFQSNTAPNGGAVANSVGSQPQLTNCTFRGNRASTAGGAMVNTGFSASQVRAINCVFFDNGGSNTFANVTAGSSISLTYSLFEPTALTLGVDVSDPGNLTTNVSPFASTTSAALGTGSTALNTGDPASATGSSPYSVTSLPATDLVGNPRIQSGRVDMGAQEFTNLLPCNAILYVSESGSGLQDGSSWANAMPGTQLQLAINTAASCGGGQVLVAQGLYKPTSTTDRTTSFSILSGVTVRGGYAADGTPGTRTAFPSSSTLTGVLTGGNRSYHVVQFKEVSVGTTLDGFVITGGNADGPSYPDELGGGILSLAENAASSPTLTNLVITANRASNGGGIHAGGEFHSLTATNSLIQNNTATYGGGIELNRGSSHLSSLSLIANTAEFGGGIAMGNSHTLTATNGLFQRNTAIGSGFGGGLFVSNGISNLNSVTFTANSSQKGGGIYITEASSSLTMTNSLLQNNTATVGGGLQAFRGGSSRLTSLSVIANHANTGGGIYVVESHTLTATNSLFQNNTATVTGGGIWIGLAQSLLVNSLWHDNVAGVSGGAVGVFGNSSSLTLLNATLYNNTAPAGTVLATANNGQARLVNSLLWGNGLAGNTFTGGGIQASYSLFETGTTSFTDGGNNLTASSSPFVDAPNGNLRLNACAPAINAGDPATTSATVGATDLAGNARFFNGTGTPTGRIDMGAYEFQGDGLPVSYSVLGSGTATCASSPTITLSGSETGVSYQLQRDGTNTGSPVVGMGSALSFGPQSLSGVYTVLATSTLGGCTALMARSATVVSDRATPTAGLLASGTITCSMQAVTLTASGEGTYSFSGPVGGPTGIVSTAGNSAIVNLGGTYSVTALNPDNGCFSSTTVIVSSDLNGAPSAPTLSASSSAVCAGTNVRVVATVIGSPTGLQWYKNGQLVTGQTSATLSLGGVDATQAGSYVLVLTGACSTTSAPFGLTVNPVPVVTLALLNSGAVLQATGGVLYERTIVIDRINGYEIRQTDSSTTGFFSITRVGPYRITVTGANGCQRTVAGVIERP